MPTRSMSLLFIQEVISVMPERGKGKAGQWPLLLFPEIPFTRLHSSLQFVWDQHAIREKGAA